MSNIYRDFLDLMPQRPLQVGTVVALGAGTHTVQLADGGIVLARGDAALNQRVFVRDGVIEGAAPALTYSQGEV